MNPKKDVGEPPGGSALTALLRSRRAVSTASADSVPATDSSEDEVTDPAPSPVLKRQRTPRSVPSTPTMDRRSWYMPKTAADALAAAVDDLHYATRQPKHAVLAALLAVALEHQDDACQRLTGEQT